jgi:hypothetical protein
MRTTLRVVIVALLVSASVAHAGPYDARRQEMMTWLGAAPFTSASRRDAVKRHMEQYLSSMDTALDSLGKALESGGEAKGRWSGALQPAKDALRTFQSNMESVYREETNDDVQTDLLRLVAEEQALLSALSGTEAVGAGADQLVATRLEIEKYAADVLNTKFPELIRRAQEVNREGAKALAGLRLGAEASKAAVIKATADARNAINDAIARISELLGKALTELELLRRDWKTWDDQIDAYRRTHNDDLVKIAEAMCSGEEWEVESLGTQMAEQIQRQLRPVYDDLKRTGEGFLMRIDNMKSSTSRAEAAPLRETIRKKLESMRKTVENGVLSGSLKPAIRARATYGMSKHQSEESSCQEREITLERCDNPKGNEGCRIDCVKVSGGQCLIIEIKPKGIKAKRKGDEQAAGYLNAVQELFGSRQHAFFEKGSGKFKVFRECFDERTRSLRLASTVQLYDFCPLDREALGRMLEW